jgi:hypothetical protein
MKIKHLRILGGVAACQVRSIGCGTTSGLSFAFRGFMTMPNSDHSIRIHHFRAEKFK